MRFDRDVAAPQFAFKEATKRSPEHLAQTLAIIPLSIGVGVVVMLGTVLLCIGLDLPLKVSLFVGGLTMASCAVVSFWRVWADELYMVTETILGHDLNNDGYIGAPVQEFNFRASERTNWRASLPAPEPVLRDWAESALAGGSLSFASWAPRFALRADGKDGVDKYRQFRDALVRAGFALERGTHSMVLTDRGTQVLTEWLEQGPSGTPLLRQ